MVAAGFATASCGYGLLAAVGADSLWLVLAGSGVLAAGVVTVLSRMTDLALAVTPVERAGSASSVLETGQEFGGALGMAALGSIGTAVHHPQIPASAPAPAREILGGALAAAQQLPAPAAETLTAAARAAFTTGVQSATATGAAVLLAAAVLAARTLRNVRAQEPELPRVQETEPAWPGRPHTEGPTHRPKGRGNCATRPHPPAAEDSAHGARKGAAPGTGRVGAAGARQVRTPSRPP